jgi:hypothetical protein
VQLWLLLILQACQGLEAQVAIKQLLVLGVLTAHLLHLQDQQQPATPLVPGAACPDEQAEALRLIPHKTCHSCQAARQHHSACMVMQCLDAVVLLLAVDVL